MGERVPGSVLHGKYQIDRLVAQGGMSRLYRGHPLDGAGQVAIKELASDEGNVIDQDDLAQFHREYEILKTLTHPGIARVLDLFEEEGRHYLVEEFVPGQSLEQRVEADGGLTPLAAVEIIDAVLDILAYLHQRHIVYRDLKPAHVIVQPDGLVRLVDFGTARRWKQGQACDTSPLGTPGYAAPEQYGGAQSDARSDIFAAGVLLHHLLTGVPPPVAGWTLEPLAPDVPRTLNDVVAKATDVKPANRYGTVSAMRAALRHALPRPQLCDACGKVVGVDGGACQCGAARRRALLSIPPALIAVLLAGVIFVGLAFIVTPNFRRSQSRGGGMACKSNLKNIGTALEMYSTDNAGLFPARLALLTPNYLKVVPTCPAAGKDTYSMGFASQGVSYTVVCQGLNHGGSGQGRNYPQYTSSQGLIAQ